MLVVAGRSDLHPLGAPGRVGAPAACGPGAWGPARDDGSGGPQHPGPPESARCRSKGGSQAERGEREALGRSRGGYGTQACVIADGLGRAVAFILAPGQAHELPQAVPLLDRLPGVPQWVWRTGVMPATPFARPSGPWARVRRSRPSATRKRSPVRSGSPPIATTWSGSLGAAERVARDCDPLREDGLKLHGRPLPCSRSRLDQAITGPSHCLGKSVSIALSNVSVTERDGTWRSNTARRKSSTRHLLAI